MPTPDLVVDDPATADSYNTLVQLESYHELKGNTTWTSSDDDELKKGAARRATTWLDSTFRSRYPGTRTDGRDQTLEWPREDARDAEGEDIDRDEIPREVKQAHAEAALRELDEPGSLSPDYVAADQIEAEQVGPIMTRYMKGGRSVSDVVPVVTIVEGILSSLFSSSASGNVKWVSRA